MGLDSVELLLSIESEFQLRIDDQDAASFVKVGDLYRHLSCTLAVLAPRDCVTAKIFYRLRQRLCRDYHARRSEVRPSAPLSRWLSAADWPPFTAGLGLRCPESRRHWLTGRQSMPCDTMGDLVWTLWSLNLAELSKPGPSVDLWHRTRKVVAETLALSEAEVCYHHRFVADLGMD